MRRGVERAHAAGAARRERWIVEVLVEAFGPLMAADAGAFRKKFRKMAVAPLAFYRGSAPLFYADVAAEDDPFANEETGRVWIQGDLHAENFGSYMNADGILVFDVNDFDDAYLGRFAWDLERMAASLSLLGVAKAFSDERIEGLTAAYVDAYLDQVGEFAETGSHEFALTLATSAGRVRDVLLAARGRSRVDLLDALTVVEGEERRFRVGSEVRQLDAAEKAEVLDAYGRYLNTIPGDKQAHSISYRVKDVVGRSGFGIGSAGLPAYNVLVEGRTEALENDVVLSLKQGNVAAPSRVVRDERIAAHFRHHGHRTAVSQLALQAHADPWLGYTELAGVGYVVRELSPYEADLDWGDLTEPEEVESVVADLGRATAKAHCVSDASSEETLVEFHVEEAILSAIGGERGRFVRQIVEFGRRYGEQVRSDYRLFVDAFRNGRVPGV